jgi:hypothetical protein
MKNLKPYNYLDLEEQYNFTSNVEKHFDHNNNLYSTIEIPQGIMAQYNFKDNALLNWSITESGILLTIES